MKLSPVVALCVVFLIVGIAAPRLRTVMPDSALLANESRSGNAILNAGLNQARTFTTNSRIKGITEALRFYIRNHGEAPNDLSVITGNGLDRDGWNRRFHYIPPTQRDYGILRSYGPDGKRSADDIWVRLRWSQLTG
jgi:hypothetical protein